MVPSPWPIWSFPLAQWTASNSFSKIISSLTSRNKEVSNGRSLFWNLLFLEKKKEVSKFYSEEHRRQTIFSLSYEKVSKVSEMKLDWVMKNLYLSDTWSQSFGKRSLYICQTFSCWNFEQSFQKAVFSSFAVRKHASQESFCSQSFTSS